MKRMPKKAQGWTDFPDDVLYWGHEWKWCRLVKLFLDIPLKDMWICTKYSTNPPVFAILVC